MKILAVDDERLALENLVSSIKKAGASGELVSFQSGKEAIDYAKTNKIDIAFLDVSMGEISGIEVAEAIKKTQPNVNIIFSTGYDEYRGDAFDLHASGYITKPITPEKVKKELDDLRRPISETNKKNNYLLKVKCFGNFDVYDKSGNIIHFERQKSKELFAYLVFRQGASTTNKEIAGVLFEDGFYEKKEQLYIQKIISSLTKTLRDINAEEVLVRTYNALSIKKEMLDCDYYKAMAKKDMSAYFGEFMAQYSWAEEFNYYFEEK